MHTLKDVDRLARRLRWWPWLMFRRVSQSALDRMEAALGVKLPEDYCEFLRKRGCGELTSAGGAMVYEPDTVVECCSMSVSHFAMSCVPNCEWATEEEHRRMWLSNGEWNPDPARFTDEILHFHGLRLLDFLLVAGDGYGNGFFLRVRGEGPCNYFSCYHRKPEIMAPSFMDGFGQYLQKMVESRESS